MSVIHGLPLVDGVDRSPEWVPVSQTFVNISGRRDQFISFNSYTNFNDHESDWMAADLKPLGIPPNAVAALVVGLLIITHGGTAETGDIKVIFRKPGDASLNVADHYLHQAIEAHLGGGIRSTFAEVVPLSNGICEFKFDAKVVGAKDAGEWPTNCAYGMNTAVRAYFT